MKEYQYIGGGHYRVTDKEAGTLVRARKLCLPKRGWMTAVLVNEKPAMLLRSVVTVDVYGFKAPKRGWVWSFFYV